MPQPKTIFDPIFRKQIIHRIENLKATTPSQWGDMNAYQMVRHCHLFESWMHGNGEWDYAQIRSQPGEAAAALIDVTKDDTPIIKHAPSKEEFIIQESEGDFALEKKQWLEYILRYDSYSNDDYIHDYFGKMTLEQIGIFAYKHSDHHLRQFGL